MFLSIIIPAYNEEKRIGLTLEKIGKFLSVKDYEYEIIVVDDGSKDDTVEIVRETELAQKGKLRILQNPGNKGKGFSIKNGILASKGKYVLFSDADLSTPIEEMDKLFSCIDRNDIVMGSRSISGSDVRIAQPWYRERMGRVFNFFVKSIFTKEFNDTQCGFKLFKGNIAREIAKDLKVSGFCFDVEMIYLALKKGYSIKEIGIIWDNSAASKVSVMSSSVEMFIDLLRIKMIHK